MIIVSIAVSMVNPYVIPLVLILLSFNLVNRYIQHKESHEINSKEVNSLLDELKELKGSVTSLKAKAGFKPGKE